MCRPMFHYTASGNVRMKMLSKIVNSHCVSSQPDSQGNLLPTKPASFQSLLVLRPAIRRAWDYWLLQKVHGVCDKDFRCAYTLTPHAELYRGFNICISAEQWNLVDHLTGHGQLFLSFCPAPPLFLSCPSQLFFCHVIFLLGSMHDTSSQGMAVGITHDVVLSPF